MSRVSDKTVGWMPESFLDKPREVLEDHLGDIVADSNSNPVITSSGDTCMDTNPELHYYAIAEYSSDDPSQVSFPEGASVLVIDQDEDGIATYLHWNFITLATSHHVLFL